MNLPVTWPDPSQPGVGHFLENRGDTSVGPSLEQHRGMSQQGRSSAPEHGQPLPWPCKAQERWAEQIPKARLLGAGHSPSLHVQTLALWHPCNPGQGTSVLMEQLIGAPRVSIFLAPTGIQPSLRVSRELVPGAWAAGKPPGGRPALPILMDTPPYWLLLTPA